MADISKKNKLILRDRLSDEFKYATMLTASWLTYVPVLMFMGFTQDDFVSYFTKVGAFFLAINIPYVRQVPLLLTRIFTSIFIARGVEKASDELNEEIDALRKKAGIRHKIRVRTYSKGITKNAFVFGHDMFIGKTLLNTMDKDELRFVLAHEITHIKNNDLSERFLMFPPYVGAFMAMIAFAFNLPILATSNPEYMDAGIILLGVSCVYFRIQRALHNSVSRVAEARADRGALKLTENFEAAVSSYQKLNPDALGKIPLTKRLFESHPSGFDRLKAMEKAHRGDNKTPYVSELREKELARLKSKSKKGKYFKQRYRQMKGQNIFQQLRNLALG